MRVALKSASNNAETSQTAGTKSPGASFFDILSQGTQGGVQATKAAGSQAQGDSDAQAQSSDQDQQSANASQTASNQSAVVASSQTAKNANTVPANSQQNAAAANTQASLTIQGNTAAQKIAALLGMVDPLSAQATLDAVSASQATQSSAKSATTPAKSAKSDTASKSDNAQTANAAQLQLVVPTQVQALPDQTIGLKNAASSPQFISPAAALTDQASGQTSSIAQTPSSRTQADASQQATAGAQAFEKSIADATANAAQTTTQDVDAAKTASQNAAQAANSTAAQSQLATQAQSAAAFLSTALGTNVLSSQGTISKAASSNAKTPNVNFNASGTTNGLASTNGDGSSAAGSNTTKKIASDANGSSQTSGDGTQRAQSDGSQPSAPAAARPADADASQAIAFGTVASTHTGAAQGSTGTATGATTDGGAKHTGEANGLPAEPAQNTAGAPALNSARLIQTMNESEMRVGLRSSEFGDISIRTMVTQQQVQAQISVDHSELASALSGHIATTQAKIGNEFGLHASIEVSQGGASFSGNQEQSSSQKDYKPFVASTQFDGAAQTVDTTEKLPLRPMTSMVEGSRLDIRA